MLFAFEGRVRGGASKMLGGKDAKTSCVGGQKGSKPAVWGRMTSKQAVYVCGPCVRGGEYKKQLHSSRRQISPK